ncbi:MAG TPA: hypothetical protein VFL36_03820, partial [Myxococcales bacterium]|nr:hypothetical protein [Myxococcales bacterium]
SLPSGFSALDGACSDAACEFAGHLNPGNGAGLPPNMGDDGGSRAGALTEDARRVIAQSTAAFRDCGYGLWLLVQGGQHRRDRLVRVEGRRRSAQS